MRSQRNGGIRTRSETQAGPVISHPQPSKNRYPTTSNLPTAPETSKNSIQPQIVGRKIENEGILDLNKEEVPPNNPKVVFVSRSRSRSTDLNARKSGVATGTIAILPKKQGMEHTDSTRNLLKTRKSLVSLKDMLQRLESLRPSPTVGQDSKNKAPLVECETKKNSEFSLTNLSHISGENNKKVVIKKKPRVLSPDGQQQSSNLDSGSSKRVGQKRRSVESMSNARISNQNSKPNTRKGSVEIDGLIKENLRRRKMQDDMKKLIKIEEEEKLKQTKEILQEKNRKIREMNARSTTSIKRRNKSQEDIPEKLPWGADQRKMRGGYINSKAFMGMTTTHQNQPKSQPIPKSYNTEKRVSELGLDLVYMKNNAGQRRSCEIIIENKNRSNGVSKEPSKLQKPDKEKIHKYMASKQELWHKQKKEKENEIKKKQDKIDHAKIRLNQMVRDIFQNARKASPKLKKHKKSKVKKDKNEEKKKYDEYKKILVGVQKEEERVRKISGLDDKEIAKTKNEKMMMKIKEQLIKEMSSLSGPESPETIEQESKTVKRNPGRMQKSQSQPYLPENNFPENSHQERYESSKPVKKQETSTERAKFQNSELSAALKNTKIPSPEKMELSKKTQKEPEEIFIEDIYDEQDQKLSPPQQNDFIEQKSEEKVVHVSGINDDIKENSAGSSKIKTAIKPEEKKSNEVDSSKTHTAQKLSAETMKKDVEVITDFQPMYSQPDSISPQFREKEQPKAVSHIAVDTEDILRTSAATVPRQGSLNLAITTHPTESIISIPPKPIQTVSSSMPALALKKPLEIDINLLNSNLEEENFSLPPKPEPDSTRSFNNHDAKKFLVTESEKSEGAANDSLDQIIERELMSVNPAKNSIFDRNSFQLFTLKKYGDQLNSDNLTKLLGMREKVILYREKTEKKYLNKMYKNKQYSPRTYQSKRKELEKWVTKEKEEIKKTKTNLLDSWKKTAEMIEEAHTNSLQIKKFFIQHAMSYNSDTNSTVSLPGNDLDDVKVPLENDIRNRSSVPNPITNSSEKGPFELPQKPPILIQENISSPSTTKHVSPQGSIIGPEIIIEPPIIQKPEEATSRNEAQITPLQKQEVSSGNIESSSSMKQSLDSEVSGHKPSYDDIEWESDILDNNEVTNQLQTVTVPHPSKFDPTTKQKDDGPLKLEKIEHNKPQPTKSEPTLSTKDQSPPKTELSSKTESPVQSSTPENREIPVKKEPSPPSIKSIPKTETPPHESIKIEPKPILLPKPFDGSAVPDTKSLDISPIMPIPITQPKSPVVVKVPPQIGSPKQYLKIEELKKSDEKPLNTQDKVDGITAEIYNQVIGEILTSLFPQRKSNGIQNMSPKAPLSPQAQMQQFLKNLATNRKKGIQTDLYHINDYLDELFGEILCSQKEAFMNSVNQAIQKDPLDILCKLQSPDQEQRMQLLQPTMQQAPHDISPVLQLDTYLELEKKKEMSKNEGEGEESQQLIEECEHIHNKAVFDAVNEALNLIRPYGLHGQPVPWCTLPRILFTKIAEPSIIIRNVKNMTLDWASFEAGTLPRIEFIIGDHFDEEYFAEIREKKLIALLAQEVLDSEEPWVNYEMEEAEVKIDVTDMIMDQLVTETAEILTKMRHDK